RERGDGGQILARVDAAEERDRRRDDELEDEEPAAPAPEEGQPVPIDERRPEELEGIRQAGPGEESDGGEADPVERQPGAEGGSDEEERQPGGEAERELNRDAWGTKDVEKVHSLRKATIGSTRPARRAGSQQARAATTARRTATPAKMSGSRTLTPT